ncbi:hypothetical protein PRZ48_008988 [Zasmidium cellare]|uniref:F-box domain-containing protein n=1 Tax=Zasmidium cellare TaxID=395010 RepID=A0ABR0EHT0_ZASCE|nr:hypothetical protein PRZ48_008988 [Zasmidium cellare]
MASATEDERKPRKVRVVSSSEKHNKPSTTPSRPAVEFSGRSIPVSDSTIMPAFQLHRRRQLRLRDQQQRAKNGQAALPDVPTLTNDFNNLSISFWDRRLGANDQSKYLGTARVIKKNPGKHVGSVSGRIEDVCRDETAQVDTQLSKKSLVVKLPVSVDPVILLKCGRAIKHLIGKDDTSFASLSINNLPTRKDPNSSKKALTTAAARMYQRKKLAPADPDTIPAAPAAIVRKESACEAVLGTTELLEHILLFLPASKILVCQRVSRTFKNCYGSSRQLRLKTFAQVHKFVSPRPPPFQIVNGVPALPFVLNPTLFRQRPRRVHASPSRWVYRMEHLVGVDECGLAVDPGEAPPSLLLRFNDYRLDQSWWAPSIGSWCEQYLIDTLYPIRVGVSFQDTRVEDQGRLIIKKQCRARFTAGNVTVGWILEYCKLINAYLVESLFSLPDFVHDLRSLILAHARTSSGENEHQMYAASLPPVNCTVTTHTTRKRLN